MQCIMFFSLQFVNIPSIIWCIVGMVGFWLADYCTFIWNASFSFSTICECSPIIMYRRRGGGSDFCTFICNVSVSFFQFVNILLFTVSSWSGGGEVLIFAHSYAMYYVSVFPLQCVNILQHNVSSAWWGSDYCTFICYVSVSFSTFVNVLLLWCIVVVVGFWFVHIHIICNVSVSFSSAVCEHTPVYHVVIVYSIVVVVRFWFLHIH